MTATRPLRDAALALGLLTVVPAGADAPEGQRTGTAAWFPAIGVALGAVVWGAAHLLRLVGWNDSGAYFVAAAFVGVWAALTRMLHWDGLADVADGLWGGHTPQRRLAIMADSTIGAFGATAIAIAMVAQVAAIGSILQGIHELPLLLVPGLGRLAATCAAWLGAPARAGGLGRSVMGAPRITEIGIAGVVVGTCVWALYDAYGTSGALLGAFGVVLALVVPHILSKPIGGVTGDVMGASIIVCETVLFGTAAMLWGL